TVAGDGQDTVIGGDGTDAGVNPSTDSDSYVIKGGPADETFLLSTVSIPSSSQNYVLSAPASSPLADPTTHTLPVVQPARGSSVAITGSSGSPTLTATNIQGYSIDAGDGADLVEVNDLAGSGISQVRLDLGLNSGTQTVYNVVNDAHSNPKY